MTPDEAKVILIAKLKGGKNKGISLLKIAQAVKILKDLEGKSSVTLGKEFDVSKSTINDFYNMNKHTLDIKRLIQRKAIGLDTSTKLFKIKNNKTRSLFAKEIAGMSTMDSRYIIDYHRRDPSISPKECKKIVLNSKTNVKEMHLVVISLEDTEFEKLKKLASKRKMSIEEISKKAMNKFLENEK